MGARRHSRGQVIAELALALPVLLFLALGLLEAGMLVGAQTEQARNTGVVADFAAEHPGEDWHAVANKVGLADCEVTVDEHGKPGMVTVGSVCRYHPIATHGLWDGLDISVEAYSAVRDESEPDPTPTPTPTETPSPSPS